MLLSDPLFFANKCQNSITKTNQQGPWWKYLEFANKRAPVKIVSYYYLFNVSEDAQIKFQDEQMLCMMFLQFISSSFQLQGEIKSLCGVYNLKMWRQFMFPHFELQHIWPLFDVSFLALSVTGWGAAETNIFSLAQQAAASCWATLYLIIGTSLSKCQTS